jgi:hypothetical protein
MVHTLILLNNFLNTSPRILLGLGSGNCRHLIVKARITLLRLPSWRSTITEQHFNLLNGLAAGFWVREPELDSAAETERSEYNEEAPSYVEKGRWDEETDGEVEDPVTAKKSATVFQRY